MKGLTRNTKTIREVIRICDIFRLQYKDVITLFNRLANDRLFPLILYDYNKHANLTKEYYFRHRTQMYKALGVELKDNIYNQDFTIFYDVNTKQDKEMIWDIVVSNMPKEFIEKSHRDFLTHLSLVKINNPVFSS